MHRQVGRTAGQGSLQFFHEQPFATHFAQAAVQYLVAPGGHAQQMNGVAQGLQPVAHMLRLPQGQPAFSGGDGEGQRGHRRSR